MISLIIVVVGIVGGRHITAKKALEANKSETIWDVNLDKRYPPTQFQKDYELAYKLYEQKKIKEGLALVRKLVIQEPRLAPDTIRDNATHYFAYYSFREMQVRAKMRSILRDNIDYAASLSKQGKHKQALMAMAINPLILRQIAHLLPVSETSLIGANGLWGWSWDMIGKELRALGDAPHAKLAFEAGPLALKFRDNRIRPMIAKWRQSNDPLFSQPDTPETRKIIVNDLKQEAIDTQIALNQWDIEVAPPAYHELTTYLQTMTK
jgi:hypothetical protein